MQKAIVTGANGFVGSAVCKALEEHGVKIIAVVRDSDRKIDNIINIKDIQIIYADLSNFGNLHNIIPDRDIDFFYHFAWVGSAGILRSDVDVQLKNIQYTCDAVKCCAAMNCKRFIFASSIMEYEVAAIMNTTTTPNMSTLYSSAKMAANHFARTIAGAVEIDYIRAVISNVYGPGELSPRLINTSLKKMMNGEHCSFSSGEQTYDFIYITDAARALIEVGEKGEKNKTYYIGSEHPKPLKEFLRQMRDCVDPKVQIGLGELQFNGASLTYKEFDIYAVKNDTGFTPEISFSDGINRTIEWIRG